MPSSVEDNVRSVLTTLLPSIKSHLSSPSTTRPLLIGISGLQGSGKSTWATHLVHLLSTHHISAITVSLDDFYLPHSRLIGLRDSDLSNKLYATRGQPGTHDEVLASRFFADLKGWEDGKTVRVPRFDKAAFNGEGDRAPEREWEVVTQRPDVLVFEGWCVGFQPLSAEEVERRRERACSRPVGLTNTLPTHAVEHLLELNGNLRRYCEGFMSAKNFDFFVHLDTEDLGNVYRWRLEQEHKLIAARGTGMSDEAVEAFIRGYMPSYELFLDGLREGLVDERERGRGKRHVRVMLGREREVEEVKTL